MQCYAMQCHAMQLDLDLLGEWAAGHHRSIGHRTKLPLIPRPPVHHPWNMNRSRVHNCTVQSVQHAGKTIVHILNTILHGLVWFKFLSCALTNTKQSRTCHPDSQKCTAVVILDRSETSILSLTMLCISVCFWVAIVIWSKSLRQACSQRYVGDCIWL